MNIHVGTSGWSYQEWKGGFYPSKLPTGAMLRHYASCFSAVEVNNSFYRIPSEKVLAGWAAQVAPEFQFIMKASRRITHYHRLSDRDGSLGFFLRAIGPLGGHLGPVLFQMPPTLEKDAALLASFLEKLPAQFPAAMEFRHASWRDDQILELLRSFNVALVGVDEDPDEGPGFPLIVTSTRGYLRLRRTRYSDGTLQNWVSRIRDLSCEQTYVFLKHEEGSPDGPVPALRLKRMLDEATGDGDHVQTRDEGLE